MMSETEMKNAWMSEIKIMQHKPDWKERELKMHPQLAEEVRKMEADKAEIAREDRRIAVVEERRAKREAQNIKSEKYRLRKKEIKQEKKAKKLEEENG